MTISVLATLVAALKFIAIALSGAFGVVALLVDYKDKSGAITRWGRVALVGVIASAGVSASIQGLEYVRADFNSRAAAERALEQTKRAEAILVGLERAIQPLETPRATVVLSMPTDLADFEELVASLRELGARLQANPGQANQFTPDYYVSSTDGENRPLSVRIGPGSQYWPTRDRDPELYTLLSYTGAEVSFVSADTDLAAIRSDLATRELPPGLGYFGDIGDYAFSLSADDDGSVELGYHIDEDELELWVSNEIPPEWIRRTGRIASVPDLEASVAMITVDDTVVPDGGGGEFAALHAGRRTMAVSYFSLTVSGRDYYFGDADISSFDTPSGLRVFEYGPIANAAADREAVNSPP